MRKFSDRFRELHHLSLLKKGRKQTALQVLAVLITLVCLYLAFKGINWRLFLIAFLTANFKLFPLVIILSVVSYFIRALRWRVLLNFTPKPGLLKVFWANMVGYLGNNIFPARAGEIIRTVYLASEYNISATYVFATCMLERVGDVFALVFIGSSSLLVLNLFDKEFEAAIIVFFLVGISGIFLMAGLPKYKNRLFRIIKAWHLRGIFENRVEKEINNFSIGVGVIKNKSAIFRFSLYTIVIWLLDAISTVIGGSIFHIHFTLPIAFVLLAALGLSSAIPSTPGYIGVYQFVSILVLVPLGYSQETAVAYMTASQIIGIILVAILGLLGLSRFPIPKSQIEEEIAEDTVNV